MNNQHNIDDLFSKASTQPLVSSFGETKELFLSTVGAVSVAIPQEKSRVFTPKKVVIMLTIISTAIAGLILLQSEEQQDNLEVKAPEKIETAVVVDKKKDAIHEVDSEIFQVKVSKKSESRIPEFMEIMEAILNPEPVIGLKVKEPEFRIELKNSSLEKPYVFPQLTDKEITNNNNEKKKMIKALLKRDKKQYAYIPSGTFKYDGDEISVQAFIMSSTEVTNKQYKTFLFDLLIQGKKDEFLKAKPDQALWTKMFGKGMKIWKDRYFSDEIFGDYPVVNVSREGAEMYCNWLTLEANKMNVGRNTLPINDLRIPLKAEWTYAASNKGVKGNYSWGNNTIVTESGEYLANFDARKHAGETIDVTAIDSTDRLKSIFAMDGGLITREVKYYSPNENGLYEMSGNVAEMVCESYKSVNGRRVQVSPGTAGGGWMSNENELQIEGKDNHIGLINPHPNVGFRVVMTHLGQLTGAAEKTNKNYSSSYVFPKLNDKEIAENNKRKGKMVKDLIKRDKKSYAYVPSGSFTTHGEVTSVQSFHMQTAEVSNIEYKTFLFDLLIQGRKDDFLVAKPDQAMWTKVLGDSLLPMKNLYFSDEAYEEYPVVNVSRIGAELYCKWLTIEANKVNLAKNNPMMNDVRIPVRAEWELAASSSGAKMPFPWGGPYPQNEKGCFLANFDVANFEPNWEGYTCVGMDTSNVNWRDGAMYTARTKTYNPNSYGLFNMSGNVAEMVWESNLEKDLVVRTKIPGTAGGGWMSSVEELKIDGVDGHTGLIEAHPNVGFRVVISYLNSAN